jgi:hypothetical protein
MALPEGGHVERLGGPAPLVDERALGGADRLGEQGGDHYDSGSGVGIMGLTGGDGLVAIGVVGRAQRDPPGGAGEALLGPHRVEHLA